MADINIIERLQKLKTTTQEEDKQYLNEIIEELKQSKKNHEEDQENITKKMKIL